MKVLFLTTLLPSHKLHGSEIASQNVVEALTQLGCQVSVVGYARKEDGQLQYTAQEIQVESRYVETRQAGLYAFWWLFLSLLRNVPYSAEKYRSRRYIQKLQALLKRRDYDVVIIDHAQMGWLCPYLQGSHRLIFNAHNIEHELYLQNQATTRHPLWRWIYQREARLVRQMEDNLARRADEVWTLTQHDAHYFQQVAPATPVRVINLPASFAHFPAVPPSKQCDIGLIGSWPWKPNEEGLQWFLKEVYPLLPVNLSIQVAGRGAEWLTDKYPNITYRGFVPDAQVFMSQARAVAIPMRSGGGIQIKTLDAIAAGSAIVATPVALRGIANPPQTVQVAEQPDAFAQRLVDTVTADTVQETADIAARWLVERQRRFLADIGDSLKLLRVEKT